MRAKNLVDVLNIFTPNKSLATKEELEAYFVKRPYDPLQEMERYLQNTEERTKILFTGHRGSGKSTELNRLSVNLDARFFIVKFSITKSLNLADLNYIDILLVCMLGLLHKAIDEKVKVNEGILEYVFNWLHHDITEEKVITYSEDMGLSGSLNLFVSKMEGKLRQESITRTTLRTKITPRLSELIDKINLMIPEIEENTGKEVLIIIEDIDKVDLEVARHLFSQHGISLCSIDSKMIYTFPIALRYSDDFAQTARTFNSHFILSNITLLDRQGQELSQAYEVLRDVILRRAEEDLLTESAIKKAIQLSGGLMVDLIKLIQNASCKADLSQRKFIDACDILKSANEIRNDYSIMLKPEQYALLKRINKSKKKKPVNEPALQMCLYNLSLLEYRNDEVWVDVHPIVKPLL